MAKINPAAARKRALVYGLVVAGVFVAVTLMAVFSGGGSGWSVAEKNEVKAAFTSVGALIKGDDVRIGNVRVGHVSDIELQGEQAVVTMVFEDKYKVYSDARATINARSSLGQKYVEISPSDPRQGPIDSSKVIPAAKTQGPQELADLLATFDEPTREALGSTLRQLGGGAAGHSRDFADAAAALPGALQDLGGVSRALASDDGANLQAMLRAADNLSRSFAGRRQQLGELTENLGTTLAAVNADGGKALGDVLDRAPESLRETRTALASLRQPLADTRAAMAKLHPGARALGDATPNLRGFLREAVPPLAQVQPVARQAGPAVDGLSAVLEDARPLAPQAAQALSLAREPVSYLAPYAPELPDFFTNLASALQYGDPSIGGNWMRAVALFQPESLTAAAGLQDPFTSRNPYPKPGEVMRDRESGLFGEGR